MKTEYRFPVVMAKGKHLVPFRTQKLSPSAPMVLPWRRGGRVGRRRDFSKGSPSGGPFSFLEEGDEAPDCERFLDR